MRFDCRPLAALLAWSLLSCAAPVYDSRAEAQAVTRGELARLKGQARRAGAVRVIVEVAAADPAASAASDGQAAKSALIRRLRGPDLIEAKSIPGTPHVVLELTARGMERLVGDPTVVRIQEDLPAAPQ